MSRIDWSRTARRELEEVNSWLEQFGPDLPLLMTERVETALLTLRDFPRIGSMVPDSNVRKWLVRRTPYLVFYRPTREGIRILKVRHARSNWQADFT